MPKILTMLHIPIQKAQNSMLRDKLAISLPWVFYGLIGGDLCLILCLFELPKSFINQGLFT